MQNKYDGAAGLEYEDEFGDDFEEEVFINEGDEDDDQMDEDTGGKDVGCARIAWRVHVGGRGAISRRPPAHTCTLPA